MDVKSRPRLVSTSGGEEEEVEELEVMSDHGSLNGSLPTNQLSNHPSTTTTSLPPSSLLPLVTMETNRLKSNIPDHSEGELAKL